MFAGQDLKEASPKLLDEIRAFLRLHHYSIHTERAYLDWVIRFVRFHKMRSRAELLPAESKVDDAPTPPPTPDATGTRPVKQAGELFDGFRSRNRDTR